MDKKQNKKEYITLQEATKYCDYSQEYLSLRARQGKLMAVKFKRNWLIKKEWLKEYLKQPSNYISLKQAAEYCDYSHDYLSLRARQGKLKAVKLANNWMTKKKWLDRYLKKHQKKVKQKVIKTEVVKILPPPDNLPVEEFQPGVKVFRSISITRMLRTGVVSVLIAGLLISGALAGKGFFSNTLMPHLAQTHRVIGKFLNRSVLPIIEDYPILRNVLFSLAAAGESVGDILRAYFSWLGNSFKSISQTITKAYFAFHNFLNENTKQGFEAIKNSAFSFFDAVGKFFADISQGKRISLFSKEKLLTEEIFIETEERLTEKLIEAFQQIFEKLTREGIPSKQIITEIQPIKEITKEVRTVDSAALVQLRSDIQYVQAELANRLYAPGGVITQQIYVTEPIQSPKIYQENGDIVLQTLGSGNIILSAATGLQLHGSQVVIDSTSISNPLIYLADETRVDGPITAQRITLNAPSDFVGKILDVQSAGTSKFSVDNAGTALLVGDFTITGDLSITGNQALDGTFTINASSSSSILTVTQTGNGKIFNFTSTADSTQNLGTITGITTNAILALYQQGTGSVLIATTTSSTTQPAIKITNLGTGESFIVESQDTDSSPFVIDSSGNVGIATSSPLYTLQTWGNTFIGTSTTPTLYVDTGTQNVGIGTSTPSQALHVVGNVLGSGNAVFKGILDVQGHTTSTFAGSVQITTTTQPQLIVRYDSTNYLTGSVSSQGTTTLISTGPLNLTGSGSSTWQTTNYGSLTIQSASSTEIVSGDTLTASSTNEMIFATAGVERARIDTSGRLGIATTTPAYLLHVWGSAGFGTSTTPTLYIDSGTGRVGIASSTPSEALTVAGNIFGSGNITISGNIMPTSPRTQDIGSDDYDWQNIYVDAVYANNINAASSTIAGTSAGTFTINSDAAADATSSLRFYRGVNTPHALLTWDAPYDKFNFNFPLYLSGTGTITSASSLTASSTNEMLFATAGQERMRIDTSGNVGIATSTPSSLFSVGSGTGFQVNNAGTVLTGTWEGDEIANAYIADDITASNYLSLTTWYSTTTDGLDEGNSNKYYSTQLFAADLAGTTTDALTEGSNNKYFTDERSDDRVAVLIQNGTNLTWTYNDPSNTLTGNVTDAWWNSLSDMSLTQGYIYVGDSSNNPTATSSIFIDTAGNIGIATSTPSSLLTVGTTSGDNFIVDTSGNATTTQFYASTLGINLEYFTDLTGTGLQNSAGILTLNATGDWTGTLDGYDGSDLVFSTTTNDYWASQSNISMFVNDSGYITSSDWATTSVDYWLTTKDTGDLTEGTNLYFTTARIDSHLSGQAGITYDAGEISITADSVGNTELAFDTGQHLTDTSSPTFNELTVTYGVVIATSTITNATSTQFYSAQIGIDSEYFTDLTGTGLQNSAGILTLNATGNWTGTLDGYEAIDLLDNTDTQLNEEQVQDFAFTNSLGGTETHISVTYQDATNNIDFIVSDDWYNSVADFSTTLTDTYWCRYNTAGSEINCDVAPFSDSNLTQEEVQDFAFTNTLGGTETLISVTYQDGTNDIDFVVDNNLANYSWASVDDADIPNAITVTGYMQDEDINAFSELQNWVSDKTLVNEEDIFTIDANWVNTANPWDISSETNLVAGTNITLSGDTLNVNDAFLLNTGDTGTGNYTFDGIVTIDTNTGAKPFYISRLGGATQTLKYIVDDTVATVTYYQDEVAAESHNWIRDISSGASGAHAHIFKINTVETARFNGSGLTMASGKTFNFNTGATVGIINTTFVDNDTSLMTSQAIKEKITNYGYISATLTEEQVEDYVGTMFGGTETLISVTYVDETNDIDFIVDNNLHNYSWANVVDANITDTLTCSNLVAASAVVDISTETNLVAGTNITLSDDTLNVNDAFVLNTSDTMSGSLGVGTTLTVSGSINASGDKIYFGEAAQTIEDKGDYIAIWDQATEYFTFHTAGAYVGNVGIASTTPSFTLSVNGDVGWTGTLQQGSVPWARLASFPSDCSAGDYIYGVGGTLKCSTPAAGGGSNWEFVTVNAITPTSTVGIILNASSTINHNLTVGTSTALYVDSGNGRVGIGTTGPDRKLDILDSTNPQLRITQADGSTYADFKVDSAGDLTIDAQGGDIRALDENLWVCAGGACPAFGFSGTGNLGVESDIELTGHMTMGPHMNSTERSTDYNYMVKLKETRIGFGGSGLKVIIQIKIRNKAGGMTVALYINGVSVAGILSGTLAASDTYYEFEISPSVEFEANDDIQIWGRAWTTGGNYTLFVRNFQVWGTMDFVNKL
ncbi:MAG: hypothetical protein ACKKMP_01045 [Candidatus Nealsonbacteria bacterium]